MKKIKVVNIKCEGCKKGIIDFLEKNGLKKVDIDIEKQIVSFEGDEGLAKKILTKMGYPDKNSAESKSFLTKVKSFFSCFKGKMKK
jgi:copper chaperone CopZ